jgi:hypothetical protein
MPGVCMATTDTYTSRCTVPGGRAWVSAWKKCWASSTGIKVSLDPAQAAHSTASTQCRNTTSTQSYKTTSAQSLCTASTQCHTAQVEGAVRLEPKRPPTMHNQEGWRLFVTDTGLHYMVRACRLEVLPVGCKALLHHHALRGNGEGGRGRERETEVGIQRFSTPPNTNRCSHNPSHTHQHTPSYTTPHRRTRLQLPIHVTGPHLQKPLDRPLAPLGFDGAVGVCEVVEATNVYHGRNGRVHVLEPRLIVREVGGQA